MTPGEGEQANHELDLAIQALEAGLELDKLFLERAAASLYYAAFHAARGALTVKGQYTRTHSGQIHKFNEIYGVAPILTKLLKLRTEADYAMTPLPQRLKSFAELRMKRLGLLSDVGRLFSMRSIKAPMSRTRRPTSDQYAALSARAV